MKNTRQGATMMTTHSRIAATVSQNKMQHPHRQSLIADLTHELAYERIKRSVLFDTLENNAAVDANADELAGEITALIQAWILRQVEST